MRLESALYSSKEGLSAQGQAISVVGDNISNSNTTGFKESRVNFADLFSSGSEGIQSDASATSGSGVRVSSVQEFQEAGVLEGTGRPLDVGINGNGFFIVNNGTRNLYTRAGNFAIDANGLLVDSAGNKVQGYAAGSTTGLKDINMFNTASGGAATTQVTLTGNLNANAAIGTPPTSPQTFSELAAGTSFTNSTAAYDALGGRHDITVAFTKTASNAWVAQAYIDGKDVQGGTAGKPVLVGTSSSFTFGGDGVIPTANQAATFVNVSGVNYASGATAGAFKINVGTMTQYSATSLVNSVTQDGKGAGNVVTYEIGKDGKVSAVLDSGTRAELGRIALASFPNVDGLQRAGSGTYVEGASSGTVKDGVPGSDGKGDLQASSLERSTVDIANQFINLVLFQRAYQASSQILNAANSMLRDTLGLIR